MKARNPISLPVRTKIITSYYCGPPDIIEAINLIETRTVKEDDLITHKLFLNDIVKGFQLVVEGKESIKVIIRPHENDISQML